MHVPRLLLIVALGFAIGCRPSLRIDRHTDSVTVDLSRLGEYPSSVQRIVLAEAATDQVLWEVQTAEGEPQIWKLTFVLGRNSSDVNDDVVGGRLKVKVPVDRSAFELFAHKEYKLTIWGAGIRHSVRFFSLE